MAEGRGDARTLDDLWQDLNHQGTVYEATAPAVPFLMKIALDPNSPFRLDVLLLLGSIVHGSSGPPYSPRDAAKRARQQVASAVPSLVEAGRVGDWRFVVGVAYVAVAVAAPAPELLTLINDRLEPEQDRVGRGALSIAAYLLGDRERHLIVDGRSHAASDPAFEDHVETIDRLLRHGRRSDEVKLAEYLFDAIAASDG